MRPDRYVVLLRGINVGGKNLIRMEQLRRCFEKLGFEGVRTYIQSGNVLFRAEGQASELTPTIEQALTDAFGYSARAVVLSHNDYSACLAAAPDTWGRRDDWKHNALFTLRGVDAGEVLATLPAPRPEYEAVSAGPGVLFWSVSKEHLARSGMVKLARLPAYKNLTVRNHNTTLALQRLLEELES